jgi:hypothetical protein
MAAAKTPTSALMASEVVSLPIVPTAAAPPVVAAPDEPPASGSGNKPETKVTFIEMLFALTVGEIAVQVFTLLQPVQLARVGDADTLDLLWEGRCIVAHLVLALAVVACSWIGWSHSKAMGNQEDTKDVFRISFFVLLIDLWLVINYFIIVKGVDRMLVADGTSTIPKGTVIGFVNDRYAEAFWIFVTFAGYAVWDVFTKIRRSDDEANKGWFEWREVWRPVLSRYIKRSWASLACTALAYLVYCRSPRLGPNSSEAANAVLLTDGALLALVFLFRAMKQASDKRSRNRGLVAAAVTGIAFFVCLLLS